MKRLRKAEGAALGLIALVVVVLSFSGGSTLVKASHTPGITVAFWRMVLCSGIWAVILRISEGRWLTLGDIRAAFVPGMLFGTNIAFFFTGVTRTSIATAEFTGALSPMLVIPLGALIFKERVHLRALSFGAISVVGLALVLFGAPSAGEFSWTGEAWIIAANVLWAAYLLTSRSLRRGRSVAAIMAGIMPIATIVTLPLGLFVFPGSLGQVTWRSVVFIVVLAALTGTIAHGLMVFAQHSVPIGVISMLQLSQPVLAVTWSLLFLGARVRPVQVLGMALVMVGLVVMTLLTQRASAQPGYTDSQPNGELGGTPG